GGVDNNYKFSYVDGSFKVAKKQLTPSFHADSKTYDATTTATIKDRALAGVYGSDAVGLDGGQADFDTKNVGQNKTVTWTGFSLSGTKASDYSLSTGSISAQADITKATLTVTASSPADLTYGDPRPAVGRTYAGFAAGETAAVLATAPSCDTAYSAGDDVGTYSTSCSGGVDNNYKFSYVDGSFKVAKKQLTPSFHADSKTYDATTTATIKDRALAGVYGSDAVGLDGGQADFDTKNVGQNKTVTWTGFSLSGTKASDYSLSTGSISAQADITKATLTVT